jgi:branched-chain amino acid transport system permease protein
MSDFFQFLVSGLTVGSVYALVALGFTLIYNASDVVNFAQGEFVMLGGMVTVFASAAGVPFRRGADCDLYCGRGGPVCIGSLLNRLEAHLPSP